VIPVAARESLATSKRVASRAGSRRIAARRSVRIGARPWCIRASRSGWRQCVECRLRVRGGCETATGFTPKNASRNRHCLPPAGPSPTRREPTERWAGVCRRAPVVEFDLRRDLFSDRPNRARSSLHCRRQLGPRAKCCRATENVGPSAISARDSIERPVTCPGLERFSRIELSPKRNEFSATRSDRDAERCANRSGLDCIKDPAKTCANDCARHCFLAIGCPEPGGAAASAPLSGAADTPEGGAEPPALDLGI